MISEKQAVFNKVSKLIADNTLTEDTLYEAIDEEIFPERIMLSSNQKTEAHVRKTFPDWEVSVDIMLALLLQAEKMTTFKLREDLVNEQVRDCTVSLCVLEHDVFAWGYTGFTPVGQDDVKVIYRFYEYDQDCGIEAYLVWDAGAQPQPPMKTRIERGGKWNVDELVAGILPEPLKKFERPVQATTKDETNAEPPQEQN